MSNRATNKVGQILGRKGAESRDRLLGAARELLGKTSIQKLTASAIARAAGLASQTFYLYFRDTDELLLALCREASNDTGEVLDILDRAWTADELPAQAETFVQAFYRYWDRHRSVLNLRNFLSDNGTEAFHSQRNESSMPIVSRISEKIAAADPDIAERDALARAVIAFAALERMAARSPVIELGQGIVNSSDLKRAEAYILSLLLTRGSIAS